MNEYDFLKSLGLGEEQPQDPLAVLPPAPTEAARKLSAGLAARAQFQPDLYDPASGEMTKGDYHPSQQGKVTAAAERLFKEREAARAKEQADFDRAEKERAIAAAAQEAKNKQAEMFGMPNANAASALSLAGGSHAPWAAESLPARSGADFAPPPVASKVAARTGAGAPSTGQLGVGGKLSTAPGKIDLGLDDNAEMDAAKEERRRLLQIAAVTGAGKNFASAVSGGAYKPDMALQEGLVKQSGQGIQDIKDNRKAKSDKIESGLKMQDFQNKEMRRDPNSSISKAYRQMAASFGNPVAPDMTADGVKDLLPMIDMAIKMEAMKEMKKGAKEGKEVVEAEKLVQKMNENLDPNKARGGAMAQAQISLNQAERLDALTKNYQRTGSLDSREMEEVAIGLNKLLSGSSAPARSQVEALVPHTALGSIQKLKEWLTNEPTGMNQRAFVERMMATVEREKEILGGQVRKAQYQRLAAFDKVKKHLPDQYNAVLQGYGLSSQGHDDHMSGKVAEPKASGKQVVVEVKGKRYSVDSSKLPEVLKIQGAKVIP